MREFWQAGGWSMFVVLLFGALSLAAAVAFVRRPSERGVGMIRSLSNATVFAAVGGVVTNLATVFSAVPRHAEWSQPEQLTKMTMIGLGESMSPAILGFGVLCLVWLVTAAGVRRLGVEVGSE